MKILNVELSIYCENGTTVVVSILNKNNESTEKVTVVYVQTVDGVYREDLGCSLLSYNGGALNKNDFDNYEEDIKKVIEKAENYIQSTYKVESIEGT